MGAAQGKDFPYEVAEAVTTYEGKSLWKLHKGSKKVDKSPASIFSFDIKKNAAKSPVASNCFKRFKTIRHPCIVPYLDGIELPDQINIVTEDVSCLEDVIVEARDYTGSLSWGIYQIAKALAFLNNDCQLIHGYLTLSSVFVNKAGDWKLGGLDLVSSLKDTASILRSNVDLLPTQYRPPELQKSNWAALEEAPVWAIDAWLLACFIYEVYNGKLGKTEDLKKVGKIPKDLLPHYQQMLHSNPKNRLNPQKFLESDFFENSYVETCLFLETIALKEPSEKERFFKSLERNLDEFPVPLCKYKILPQLVIALDYGSANARVLAPLLKIAKNLTGEEYTSQITPSLVKWFASPDYNLRISLLQNLENFVEHINPNLINDQIFPSVATGFTAASAAMREVTVRSMLYLVPKMNERTVNTQVLKFFAKLQMDTEPGIRTNTTICLANIAKYLTPATRQKILSAAFCRSLKDPFPRARLAGLLSLKATESFYNKDDCANKIVPSLAGSLIDPEKEVRDNAFEVIRLFINKLEKVSETGIDEVSEEMSKGNEAGYLGWAINSLSKKMWSAADGTPASSNGQQSTTNVPTTTTPQMQQKVTSPSTSKDGWSDDEWSKPVKKKKEKDEDWNDDDYEPSQSKAQEGLYKPSTSTTSAKKTITTTTTTGSMSLKSAPKKSGWSDDEDWNDDVKKIPGKVSSGWNDDKDGWNDDSVIGGGGGGSGWDVDDKNGWNDDEDDWEFQPAKSSKIDQKKQEKLQRVGKAD